MSNVSLNRRNKIQRAINSFFHDFSEENCGKHHALIVCRDLIRCNESAIHNTLASPFLGAWQHMYPEEPALDSSEFLWALHVAQSKIENTIDEKYRDWLVNDRKRASLSIVSNKLLVSSAKSSSESNHANGANAKFRIINGGLSSEPDIPFVRPKTQ